MKKNLGYVGLTVLGFALIALAADVTTDYDHSANFGKYHTYSWMSASASNSLWSDRIKNAVDSQLTAKGWQQVPSGGDATVAAIGKTSNQQTLQTFYDGFPGWRWGGFGESTTNVENQKVGTLTVDIFDTQTKKLIWRGRGENALSGNPEKNEKKLDKTVEDMFKKFPPNEKG